MLRIRRKFNPLKQKVMDKNNQSPFIGQKVIIRANRAGVFFGTLKEKTPTPAGVEVVLTNSRRIWRWYGAASLSQMAQEGVKEPDRCMFTVTVPEHNVMDVIEILPCSDMAIKSIESVKIWKKD